MENNRKQSVFQKHLFLCVLAWVYLTNISFSQIYKFQHYNHENGLPQPFIYTINQDEKGFLWIGTGEGLTRFDGHKFKNLTTLDSLAEDIIISSFQASNGDLWFGHNQGGVTRFRDGKLQPAQTATVLFSTIHDIDEDQNGKLWFTSQNDGLATIDDALQLNVIQEVFGDKLLYCTAFDSRGLMLVGTDEGLILLDNTVKGKPPVFKEEVRNIPFTKITCISSALETDCFWIGTEDEGLFYIKMTSEGVSNVKRVGEIFGIYDVNIQDVMTDRDGAVWISTFGEGVYKLYDPEELGKLTAVIHYNQNNGLNNRFVKQTFQDMEGNTWIATYGGGVSILLDDYFTFYLPDSGSTHVYSILNEHNQRWLGSESGILRNSFYPERKTFVMNHKQGLPNDKVCVIYRLDDGQLIAGTESSGLYIYNPSDDFFNRINYSKDFLSNSINGIVGDGYFLWVATKGGVHVIEPNSGNHYSYTTENGLPHNNINHIFKDSKGRIWIATQSNYLCIVNGQKVEKFKINQDNQMLNVSSITEDEMGSIWISTYGNGVYNMTSSSFVNYGIREGLKSNYCYSIIADFAGHVWVGHQKGLSRIDLNKDDVRVYEQEDGITGDCHFNAAYKDREGTVWIGTSKGAINYNPKKDKKNLTPPLINITDFEVDDRFVSSLNDISLPYDEHKIRVDFIGVSFKEPDKVRYSYILDGHDAEWSEMTTINHVIYYKIDDGNYTFRVKACNNDGVCNEIPASFSFSVKAPYWKTWWFILLCVGLLTFGITYYVKVREKRHKEFQAFLKKNLDERTKEVVDKTIEIEKKNKDLTDSIRYAKRIQEAILPPESVISDCLEDYFILYRPKDIVSGDFYWLHKINGKTLCAAVDCTGHGVPGALMSVVGSNGLNHAVKMNKLSNPGEILNALNENVNYTMHQMTKDSQSKDGMDISMVSIDFKKKKMEFAGAFNPIYLYPAIKDENRGFPENSVKMKIASGIEIKGNRFSIGPMVTNFQGSFDTQYVDLKKGDMIYLFSDGYADQFGGSKGKKYKYQKLKIKLEEINQLPTSEQERILIEEFENWMGENEQVDDVCLIGIRI